VRGCTKGGAEPGRRKPKKGTEGRKYGRGASKRPKENGGYPSGEGKFLLAGTPALEKVGGEAEKREGHKEMSGRLRGCTEEELEKTRKNLQGVSGGKGSFRLNLSPEGCERKILTPKQRKKG